MLSWTNNFLEQTKESFDDLISDAMNIKREDNSKYEDLSKNSLHYPFKLPIEYVNEKELHKLSPVVNEDLELVISKGEISIYEQLFQPTNIFGTNMIKDWSNHFTSNEQYLLDTQLVISEENIELDYNMEDETMMDIWTLLWP